MRYFLLGIGGIGMSALARWFHQRGDTVGGYDRTPTPLTRQLEAEGMTVIYDDDPALLPAGIDLAIYTPAVPPETAVMQRLLQQGVPMQKRSQALGALTRGKRCVAVAGTHGKTSTSSLVAHILSRTAAGCSAFLGGIAKNFDSNIVVSGGSDLVVVEADEYDRSFLQLHPHCAVITSTDADHLDVYGTHENMLEAFRQFALQTDAEGPLIVKQGIPLLDGAGCGRGYATYTARGMEADYYSCNVRNYDGNIYFDLRTPQGAMYDMMLPDGSLYNVENAVAAAAAALSLGADEHQLRYGLKTYKGVRRRFDFRIKTKDLVMIDDYAHHPQEIAACLESIRYLYPGRRVVGIFQPHLYSRTRDFADQFAEVLSTLDEAVLLPIYPARERPILGITSSMLLRKMEGMSKYLCTPDQALELVPALCPDVVVTLGAGDIDRLVPRLEEVLKNSML